MKTTPLNHDISIIELTKIFRLSPFRKKTAVSSLTLEISQGKLVGLLGPNGSGKSTTLKIMLGFLKPTSGEIRVCGYSSHLISARSNIGYLPENPRFQKFLTGFETLVYYGKLLKIKKSLLVKRIDELLMLVNLSQASKERVHGYSKGMTQRLAIAQALLNNPPVLVFDEPMSGLDPVGRIEVRKLIRQIHQHPPQKTIFFSTHILGDVEELCSDVALLKNGKLATYCSLSELLNKDTGRYDITVQDLNEDVQQRYLRERKGMLLPSGLTFTLNGTDELIRELSEMKNINAKIVKITSHRRSLEEALFSDTISSPSQHSNSNKPLEKGTIL